MASQEQRPEAKVGTRADAEKLYREALNLIGSESFLVLCAQRDPLCHALRVHNKVCEVLGRVDRIEVMSDDWPELGEAEKERIAHILTRKQRDVYRTALAQIARATDPARLGLTDAEAVSEAYWVAEAALCIEGKAASHGG